MNTEEVELFLVTLLTGVIIAVISWAERKFPWIGVLFGFRKTPSYEG